VGLLLLAVALVTPLAIAARRLRGPERHAYAGFLAAAAALLVHAGVDWDWEMPALSLLALVLAARLLATIEPDAPTEAATAPPAA
jgi:ABC-type Mn2+/Zn2+ transport system permease subunit